MGNYSELDTAGFYKKFLLPNGSTFVNIAKIVALFLTVPVTSVNCERAISSYNLIKSDRRNRMSIHSTDTQMILKLEAPTPQKNAENYLLHV